MKLLTFIILICLLSCAANAEDFTSIAIEADKNKMEKLQKYLQIAQEAKSNEQKMISTYKDDTNLINNNMTPIKNKDFLKSEKNNSNAIIFISFSMPDQSIISLVQDARKIHASVVIRGLIHNSFKETFIKMASIVKESGGGGVELNPLLFKKYNIKAVPAVVVVPNDQSCFLEKICSDEKFDVIYGDIPIFNALKTIRDHGSVSNKKAEELLLNMEGAFHV